jgi:1,4-alpha-glucan branching enzyme
MLYLDYSRQEGEWIPNPYGGNENLEAIYFLRKFNEEVYKNYPDAQTIAEESTAWPMVSRPNYVGGLGFGLKWDMGWMHDTLEYMSKDPIFRKYYHNSLTFRMLYAFTENFVLPLSHDEVVHGKGSLLRKMPGDDWQKFANLRLLFGYMYGQPGKKLLFMGGEFGQWDEWYHETSLDWHLLQYDSHAGMQRWVEDLNRLYRSEPALHQQDFTPAGFEWIDCTDLDNSVVSFLRKGKNPEDVLLIVANFTPVVRLNYRVGVHHGGFWKEILNSDSTTYWGSGQGNLGGMEAAPIPSHGRYYSLNLTLPPLGIVFFKPEAY